MPAWLLGILLVATTLGLSIGGLLVVRRLVAPEKLEPHHDVAAALLSVVGVAYGVLLAFSVFLVWSNYAQVQATASIEADAISKMKRLSTNWEADTRRPLENGLNRYGRYVVDTEWYGLADGLSPVEGQRLFDALFQDMRSIDPQNDRGSDVFSSMLSVYQDMADARRARVLALQSSVPAVAWVALIGGSVATIVFTYFFGLKNLRLQILMTGILATTIALNLLLIIALDRPFGTARIPPYAFEELRLPLAGQ
jgi:hypothetical protein